MFKNFYVTDIGHALLAKSQGGAPIQFTRFVMGKGWLPSGQDIEEVTAMVDPIKTLAYAIKVSGTVAAISAQVTNQGITSNVEFRELGLFATDPDKGEILYAYANAGANADLIPPATESQVDYYLSFACKMRNASVIEIAQQPSLVLVSLQQFEGHVKDYDNPHKTTLGQLLGGGSSEGELDGGNWDTDGGAMTIKLFRGNAETMPLLAEGEPAFTLDEGRFYVGDGTQNIPFARVGHTHPGAIFLSGDIETLANVVIHDGVYNQSAGRIEAQYVA